MSEHPLDGTARESQELGRGQRVNFDGNQPVSPGPKAGGRCIRVTGDAGKNSSNRLGQEAPTGASGAQYLVGSCAWTLCSNLFEASICSTYGLRQLIAPA